MGSNDDNFSLAQCVMAAFSPPHLFAHLAGRSAFLCGFLFRWVLQLMLSMIRSVLLHDAASCSREVLYVNVWTHVTHCPCFFFSVLTVSAEPILIGAGD